MTPFTENLWPHDTIEISVEAYCRIFTNSIPHQLLDVREPWEINIAHLNSSISIPLQHLSTQQNQLSKDCWTVIYCHHGVRSLRACHLLKEQGFDKVLNLTGGINQWSHVIDTSIPIY